MTITIVLVGFVFLTLYIKKTEHITTMEGFKIGILFFIISIIVDLFLFMEGPMKIPISNYMLDIGLTYLVYPILGFFTGYINNLK